MVSTVAKASPRDRAIASLAMLASSQFREALGCVGHLVPTKILFACLRSRFLEFAKRVIEFDREARADPTLVPPIPFPNVAEPTASSEQNDVEGSDAEDVVPKAVPEDTKSPRITVTIRVSDDLTGELYIARREIFAYDATLVTPDRIEGTVTDDSEQLVIGASDPVFATSPANWRQHPDPAKSPMILVRVDDDWDCDRLAAERDALFPPTPDVDW